MVSFATAKKNLMILGILPVKLKFSKRLRKYQTTINHLHILLYFSILSLANILSLHYFLFRAKNIGEYFETGLIFILTVLRIMLFVTLLLKKSELSQFLKEFEDFIVKSELNSCRKCLIQFEICFFLEITHFLIIEMNISLKRKQSIRGLCHVC